MDVKEQELRVNNGANRFELEVEGHVAFIDYTLKRELLFLIHTEVPEALQGKGIAGIIVQKTFEYAKKNGYQIVPLCPYVRTYLERHPEWKELVAPNSERYLNNQQNRDDA
jgi:predicted GNAT family acetyltransferase